MLWVKGSWPAFSGLETLKDGREGARMAQPCPSPQASCPTGPRKQEWVVAVRALLGVAGPLTHLRSLDESARPQPPQRQ